MTENQLPPNLPAQIVDAIAGIPKALVPACLKAVDRLVGAAVDIPVAWLAQQKARIDAQSKAYGLVEDSISKAAASLAEKDPETVQRAAEFLVRKEYRKQINREAIARTMLQDLTSNPQASSDQEEAASLSLDDDWLNVFERYAEDASSERMQNLWGRVIAGEVRKPGRFSMRTLRFLSEFSQADGLTFDEFSKFAFSDSAPTALAKPEGMKDIRHLIDLEAAGLIQGPTGLGLSKTHTFDSDGNSFLIEGNIVLHLSSIPGEKIAYGVMALTPLGQELLGLLPNRDVRQCARDYANAIKTPQIKAVFLGFAADNGQFIPTEVVWQDSAEIINQTDITPPSPPIPAPPP